MIVGVDTSGKIKQAPLYVAIVRLDRKDDAIRKVIKKAGARKSVLLSRRSVKAVDLTEDELKFFMQNLKNPYAVSVLTVGKLRGFVNVFRNVRNWRYKLLAAQIHFTSERYVVPSDVVVIDRDYTSVVMDELCNCVKRLFKADGKEVHVLVGSRYTEDAIALADLVAGSARKSAVLARKFELEDAKKRLEKL
jgi:hypothetical protein